MERRDVEVSVVSIEILNERRASVPEVMEKMSVVVEREGVIRNRVGLACNEVMVCIVRFRSPMMRDSPVILPGYRSMTDMGYLTIHTNPSLLHTLPPIHTSPPSERSEERR